MALRVLETGNGAVAEAADHRHERVEVLQLQQFLWMRREETLGGGMEEEEEEKARECVEDSAKKEGR